MASGFATQGARGAGGLMVQIAISKIFQKVKYIIHIHSPSYHLIEFSGFGCLFLVYMGFFPIMIRHTSRIMWVVVEGAMADGHWKRWGPSECWRMMIDDMLPCDTVDG